MQIYTIHLKVANKSTGFFGSRVNKRQHTIVHVRLPYSTDRRKVVKIGAQFDRDSMTVGEYIVEQVMG